MDLGTLAALLASLVFLGAIMLASTGRRRPSYWALAWATMIGTGTVLILDLPGVFDHAARFAATLFPGLQLAGAYRYVGAKVPRILLPATLVLAVTRCAVALAGHHELSHAVVLPGELAMIGWAGRVVLGRHPAAREPMDWLLAFGAASLCGLETMDAVYDMGGPDSAVMWAPWLVLGSAVGVLQTVGVGERTQRVAVERRREQEERERTAQRLESLGTMAGGVAHDFNNLLTGVVGNTDLALLDLPEGHRAREPVQLAAEHALRAAELAGQMLAYASGRPLERQSIDLAKRVRERTTLLRSAVSTEIAVHVDAPEGLPDILADSSQIDQVLLNLAINAGEACEAGGSVRIRVEGLTVDGDPPPTTIGELQPGIHLRLSVRDDGAGLQAPASRLFDPFFSTKFSGRGMGLAVTQQTVRSHDGAIAVRSDEGGTCFYVYFPAADHETSQAAPITDRAMNVAARGRILVVDDEPQVLQVVETALRGAGYEIRALSSGQDALRELSRDDRSPSLVLLDATMPKVGAHDVIRFIETRRPSIPILMMTGHDTERIAEAFGGPCVVGWLRKPFRVDALRQRVAAELNRHRAANPPSRVGAGAFAH